MKKYLCLLFVFFVGQQLSAQKPVITTFSPASAPIGTTVTITGTNFSAVPANNIVFFGAVRAMVTSSTPGSMMVTVPTGATYQPISVTVNSLTSISAKPFIVTFSGGGNTLTTNSFAPAVQYPSGQGPACIASGDFDGDGKPDLVSVNDTLNTFSVFRNTSSGGLISLSAKLDFSTGNKPYSVAVGDLDGDGKQDIAVANGQSNTISVFRNNSTGPGNISFTDKLDLASGSAPFCVAIGDFDGDGKPDLASTASNNRISIFQNYSTPGSFSFSLKTDFVTGTSPYWIAVGDLNNDGKPELATANATTVNSISVLPNNSSPGNISFGAKLDIDGGGYAYSIALGDIDNDNKPDLIAVGENPNVAVLLNRSNGAGNITFAPRAGFSTGSASFGVSLSDIDGDGKPDIAVSNTNSNTISILRNTSSTGFVNFDQRKDYTVGTNPWGSVIVDLDCDGKPEIATANQRSANISVIRNRITEPAISSFSPVSSGYGAVVNVYGSNLDSITQVYFGGLPADSFTVVSSTNIVATVGNGNTGALSVSGTNGSHSLAGFTFTKDPTLRSFSPSFGGVGTMVHLTGTNFNTATAVYFGSSPALSFTVNSPTSMSAVVGAVDSEVMTVAVLNAFGTASLDGFYTGPSVTSFYPKYGPVGTIVTIKGFHFDPDISKNKVFFGAAKADIVEVTDTTLRVSAPANTTFDPVTVLSNAHFSSANEPFTITFPEGDVGPDVNSFVHKGDSSTGNYPISVAKADFDNDGKTDLVTANYIGASISIFQNASTPGYIAFKSPINYSTTSLPFKVGSGDLDGDGKPDIVVLNKDDNKLLVFRNTTINGNISFAPAITIGAGPYPMNLCIGDMDKDGKADLIVLNESSSSVSVFRNVSTDSNISFEARVDFYTLNTTNNLTIGDIDNDGKPEILVLSGSNDRFTVLKNKCISGESLSAGSFEKSNSFQTGVGPQSILLADFDNDGLLDVGVGNKGNETISVLKNTSTATKLNFANKQDYYFGTNTSNSNQVLITAADINGDGKIDIYFPGYSNNNTIFKNLSDVNAISFSTPINCFSGDGSSIIARYVLCDLDGDGKPDIALNNQENSKITFFRNQVGEPASTCNSGNISFKTRLTGLNYSWQVNTGAGFNTIDDNSNYSGTNTPVVSVRNIPSIWYGNQYRCIVDGIIDAPVTLAFTNFWTGTQNTDWGNVSNWSCGRVPDENTDVIINSGSIVINSTVSVRSLKINPGVILTVNTGFQLIVRH